MHNFRNPFQTLWSTKDDAWQSDDWRIVGTRRSNSVIETLKERKINEPIFGEAFYITTSKKFENMNAPDIIKFLSDSMLYVVEFGSKRVDICYSNEFRCNVDQYVIIEADRGEDCGKILGMAKLERYRQLLMRLGEITKEVQPKKIFRKAHSRDMEVLRTKTQSESEALEMCRKRVKERGLEMDVVNCEYQWDRHKLTFFFVSDKRIDFRELVKELYKVYKTRIWMCAVEKSKNCYLRELLEE